MDSENRNMLKEKNNFSGTGLQVWPPWELSSGSHTKQTLCTLDSMHSAGRERRMPVSETQAVLGLLVGSAVGGKK